MIIFTVRAFVCPVNTQRRRPSCNTSDSLCRSQCRLSVLDRLLIYVTTSFSDVCRHQSLWAVNVCSRWFQKQQAAFLQIYSCGSRRSAAIYGCFRGLGQNSPTVLHLSIWEPSSSCCCSTRLQISSQPPERSQGGPGQLPGLSGSNMEAELPP